MQADSRPIASFDVVLTALAEVVKAGRQRPHRRERLDRARAELDRLLEQTARLPDALLATLQLEAAAERLAEARRRVPFYQQADVHYARALDDFVAVAGEQPLASDHERVREAVAAFRAIPLLDRDSIQDQAPRLVAQGVPDEFRRERLISTSGSTGRPMVSARSAATFELFNALNRRFHRVHGNAPQHKAAFIRTPLETELTRRRGWLSGSQQAGDALSISLHAPAKRQLELLLREKPRLLVVFPSQLALLLAESARLGKRPSSLQQVVLMAETVAPELFEQCRKAWHVEVTSTYSSAELGPIAMGSPEQPSRSVVQSENVLLEVLDDDDSPALAGQVGQVVATTLLDPLRPLVRYRVGDYAQLPETSDGWLPSSLERVVGRQRNMFLTHDGRQLWPYFRTMPIAEMSNVRQWKLVQRRAGELEVRLVVQGELSQQQREVIRGITLEHLPEQTKVEFRLVEQIPRSTSGKFEDFESQVTPGAVASSAEAEPQHAVRAGAETATNWWLRARPRLLQHSAAAATPCVVHLEEDLDFLCVDGSALDPGVPRAGFWPSSSGTTPAPWPAGFSKCIVTHSNELAMARRHGFSAQDIYVLTPHKPDALLHESQACKARWVVESSADLQQALKSHRRLGGNQDPAVAVALTHAGSAELLGLAPEGQDWDALLRLAREADMRLTDWLVADQRVLHSEALRRLWSEQPPLRVVSMCGPLPQRDPRSFVAAVARSTTSFERVLTRVMFTKEDRVRRFVVVDAELQPQALEFVGLVTPQPRPLVTVSLWGSRYDQPLLKDVDLPHLEPGDELVIQTACALTPTRQLVLESRPDSSAASEPSRRSDSCPT